MATSPTVEGFPIPADSPIAAEHQCVSKWIEEAASTLDEDHYYQDVELKCCPSGATMLAAKPESARRYVIAAVAQTMYWDDRAAHVRAQAKSDMERNNVHHLPGWAVVWGRRRKAETVVRTLMRRTLPLEEQDVSELLQWCNHADVISSFHYPINHIVRALERYAAHQSVSERLMVAMQMFASRLRASHDKDIARAATAIEQIFAGPEVSLEITSASKQQAFIPAPTPAHAGLDGVLEKLKQLSEMLPAALASSTTIIGPDLFPLPDHSPLRAEHELLSSFFEQVIGKAGYNSPVFNAYEHGQKLLSLEPIECGRVILAACERHIHALTATPVNYEQHQVWQSRSAAAGSVLPLLNLKFSLPREGMFDVLLFLSTRSAHEQAVAKPALNRIVAEVEQAADESPLVEGERYVLHLLRASIVTGPALGKPSNEANQLTRLIGDGACFCLVPGEVWTDAVNDDFTRMSLDQRRLWAKLFAHTLTATSARPSAKWLKSATTSVKELGDELTAKCLARWFPLVTRGQSLGKLGLYVGDTRSAANTMHDENATCLRGLLWMTGMLPQSDDLMRQITSVAMSAYKKVPGVGPRAVKVGNAAVFALSEMSSAAAVGQLAMLKVRVKFGTAQKEIEKAFNLAAESLGLPRDQIEELGVPSYGLEEVGKRCEMFGDYRAELEVTGSDATIGWFDAKGKLLKAVPAKVKKDHREDFKELIQSLKDIQGMLPAQRDRIDSMFLLQKSWPIDSWRDRYLNHPLIGTIARRLLWCVDGATAIFVDGKATDADGEPIAHGKTAEITLWHPVGRETDEILSWRRRLETLSITQPFKQAHREVYLLTYAERNTRTYSNRFAAHIIRQHQFNALCAARNWKNKLRLMVDDTYPPAIKLLPQWGLRAEFWVEGVGDGYGVDTNEAGVYLRLATDQVRFYRTEAAVNVAHAGGGGYNSPAIGPGHENINEALSLDEVPTLVFSEIMRDVDLFVGVASVANDPAWQDGGPQGRYRDYWQNYSLGDLSNTASTRKQVLERLVPRLKIAAQCSFSDRFLIVRGQKRTYKIHLGSGNILMEPNDQYLCIVPDSRSRVKQDEVFLPFEGDSTLSIIISKALLLAEDTKIKDPTITRQIDGL